MTPPDSSSNSHDFVRIDALVWLLAEELLNLLLNLGGPGHTANQDHVIYLLSGDAGVFEGFLTGPNEPL